MEKEVSTISTKKKLLMHAICAGFAGTTLGGRLDAKTTRKFISTGTKRKQKRAFIHWTISPLIGANWHPGFSSYVKAVVFHFVG